jgi:Holliday junction resolvase
MVLKEEELFNLLKKRLIRDLRKVDNEFSNYDCISDEDNAYIELKCRRTHYNYLMIERYKYDKLVEQAQEFNYNPVYINSTPEGVWAFNLNYVQPRWYMQDNLPKTTDFENTEKVTKEVGYLNVEGGVKLW